MLLALAAAATASEMKGLRRIRDLADALRMRTMTTLSFEKKILGFRL